MINGNFEHLFLRLKPRSYQEMTNEKRHLKAKTISIAQANGIGRPLNQKRTMEWQLKVI